MKVYDLGTTSWLQLTPTVSNQNNINAVNSNSANINTVASDLSGSNNIGAVASNSTNINLTAGSIGNVNNVGNNIASVTTAANNLADINSFANIYLGPSGSAPSQDPDGSALDVGDLYFDTSSDQFKSLWKSSGWQNAGSSVNGTSARFKYTATAGQTTFTGNDDNSNNLSFDPGFADIFINGVKLVRTTDYVDTSGSSIVLQGSGAALNDTLEIVAYGTF